jgi:hypothetical protein
MDHDRAILDLLGQALTEPLLSRIKAFTEPPLHCLELPPEPSFNPLHQLLLLPPHLSFPTTSSLAVACRDPRPGRFADTERC